MNIILFTRRSGTLASIQLGRWHVAVILLATVLALPGAAMYAGKRFGEEQARARLLPEEWKQEINNWKSEADARSIMNWEDDGKLHVAHLIADIWKSTGGNAIVSTDVGQHQMWTAQYYQLEKPNRWLTSGGAGTMEHFRQALTDGKADAALAASVFHYNEMRITDLKDYLYELNVPVRIRGWEYDQLDKN